MRVPRWGPRDDTDTNTDMLVKQASKVERRREMVPGSPGAGCRVPAARTPAVGPRRHGGILQAGGARLAYCALHSA
jgi:hypothetical protein